MKNELNNEERIKEFINCKNLYKFNKLSKIEFSDKTFMGAWFYFNGINLLGINNEITNEFLQYLSLNEEFDEVLRNGKKTISNIEVIDIYFKHNNIKENLNTPFLSLYDNYVSKNKNNFDFMLLTFIKDKRIEKFSPYNNDTFTINHNILTSKWFYENFEKIINHKILGSIVRKQYNAFLKTVNNKNNDYPKIKNKE